MQMAYCGVQTEVPLMVINRVHVEIFWRSGNADGASEGV